MINLVSQGIWLDYQYEPVYGHMGSQGVAITNFNECVSIKFKVQNHKLVAETIRL